MTNYTKSLLPVILVTIILSICQTLKSSAQSQPDLQPPKTKLTNLGDVKYFLAAQLWARYTEMNPGTIIGTEETTETVDFSIRRLRLGASSQSKNIYWKLVLGLNNMNQATNRNKIGILDAYAKWTPSHYFHLGAGKSLYSGLSRYSAPSSASIMTLDLPTTIMTSVNKTDDFLRQNSIFIEGQVGKVDYSLVLAKPFNTASTNIDEQPDFYPSDGWEPSGYVVYRFWDKESLSMAAPGTYLGKKRLLNLGVGFLFRENATWNLTSSGDTIKHNLFKWAVDILVDMPLDINNNQSMTFYSVLMNADYGTDYVRNLGLNNIATGANTHQSFNGAGNAFPGVGTGTMSYSQAGYRWRTRGMKTIDSFIPFFAINVSNYDALNDLAIIYDYGINIYLNQQHSKLSIAIQNRPIFRTVNTEIKRVDYKTMVVLQYQILLKS